MSRFASAAGPPASAVRSVGDELIVRFLAELARLEVGEWQTIAARLAAEQKALAAQRSRLAKLRSEVVLGRATTAARQKEVVAFNRWAHERLLAVIEALPSTAPGADGRPFPLRATANAAAGSALAVLRVFDAEGSRRVAALVAPALRPFQGFVTLPPLPDPSMGESRVRARTPSDGPPAAYHLLFPDDFFTFSEAPPAGVSAATLSWSRRETHHESWHWAVVPGLACRFGGRSDRACAVCGGGLHRLVSLPPLPGPHFEGVGPAEIVSCLSCLGWSEPILHFVHDASGRARPTGYGGGLRTPEHRAGPLREATVDLAATPKRWARQRWEDADGQNLNRIGGSPSWIQDAEVPRCCDCRKRMRFLLQLDSELPTAEGQRWRWGSGGLLYVFWCAVCRIDAQLWQCS